jgi:hypothetical protein
MSSLASNSGKGGGTEAWTAVQRAGNGLAAGVSASGRQRVGHVRQPRPTNSLRGRRRSNNLRGDPTGLSRRPIVVVDPFVRFQHRGHDSHGAGAQHQPGHHRPRQQRAEWDIALAAGRNPCLSDQHAEQFAERLAARRVATVSLPSGGRALRQSAERRPAVAVGFAILLAHGEAGRQPDQRHPPAGVVELLDHAQRTATRPHPPFWHAAVGGPSTAVPAKVEPQRHHALRHAAH